MGFSLYDAFVPTSRQLLGSLDNLIDKGEAFAREQGIDDAEMLGARLAEDMWPLPWHIRSCWLHAANTLDQLQGGEFTPDFTVIPDSWDAMRAMVAEAKARLDSATPEEIDAIGAKTVGFILGGNKLFDMSGANFLLSFNQLNIQFHATTFYDILRMKGVKIGKRDYMGALPVAG